MLCTLAAYHLLFAAFLTSECIKEGMYVQQSKTTGQNSTHERNALQCQVWVCARRVDFRWSADIHTNTVSQQRRCQVAPNCAFFTFNLKTRQCFLSPLHASWTPATGYKAGPRVCGKNNDCKLFHPNRFMMVPPNMSSKFCIAPNIILLRRRSQSAFEDRFQQDQHAFPSVETSNHEDSFTARHGCYMQKQVQTWLFGPLGEWYGACICNTDIDTETNVTLLQLFSYQACFPD